MDQEAGRQNISNLKGYPNVSFERIFQHRHDLYLASS